MMELQCHWHEEAILDGRDLRPEILARLEDSDILDRRLDTERGPVRLGDAFTLKRSSDHDDRLVIDGDCSRIDGLGASMTEGVLIVRGNVGSFFGDRIQGGILIATGDAGNFTCSAMTGGTVGIGGGCGDRFGAPKPGARSGIRGGDVFIAGNLGDRACERMRRGTVIIGGDAGDYLAPHMIAGTVVIMGDVGTAWGLGMRRGSLIFAGEPNASSAGQWSPRRGYELSFLPLIWNHWRATQRALRGHCEAIQSEAFGVTGIPTTRWVERQLGDLSIGGRGEVLWLQRMTALAESTPLATIASATNTSATSPVRRERDRE